MRVNAHHSNRPFGSSNEPHKAGKLLSLFSPNHLPSSVSWNNYCCVLWQAHFHIKRFKTTPVELYGICQKLVVYSLPVAIWFSFDWKSRPAEPYFFFFFCICLTTHSKCGIQPVTSASLSFPLKHLLTFHIPLCLSVSNFTARKRPALS